jgi:hypothetical protein
LAVDEVADPELQITAHVKERIELLLPSGRGRHAELLAQLRDQLAAQMSR